MQKIKVAQFGLGPIGVDAVRLAGEKEWIEVVGGVDIDPGKVGKTVGEIAREYQVHPNQVSQWKGEVVQRLPEVFESGPTVQAQEQEKQIARLERKIGQLTMDLEWLEKKSKELGL